MFPCYSKREKFTFCFLFFFKGSFSRCCNLKRLRNKNKFWTKKKKTRWNCQVSFFFLAFLMLFNSPLLTTWQRSEKSAFPPTSLVSLFLPFSFCHRLLSPLPAARRCSTPPVSHSHLIISLTWTLSRDSSAIKLRRAPLLPAHSLPHCSGPTLQHSGLDWSPVDDPACLWPTRPQPSAPDYHFYFNTSWFLSVCSDDIAEWVSPILSPVDPSLQNPFPAWHISQPEHTHLSLLAVQSEPQHSS